MTEPFGHPYQLRRIELRDFKSVAEASVNLKPLTVVVGANSSGKSTLLQSILAVTQAVRAGTSSAEFPLNGEFVRLGTFDETRNFLAAEADSPMEVAFRLADWRDLRNRVMHGQIPQPGERSLVELSWRAYIDRSSAAGETSGGFAWIRSLQIELESVEPGAPEKRSRILTCDVSDFGTEADRIGAQQYLGRRGRFPMHTGSAISATGRVQDWASGESGAIDAVVLAGGVPQTLMRSVGQLDRLAEVWWNTAEAILEEEIRLEKLAAAEATEIETPRKVTRTAVNRAKDHLEALDFSQASTAAGNLPITRGMEAFGDLLDRRWYRDLGQLNKRQRTALARSMVGLGEAKFRSELRKKFRSEAWIDEEVLVEHSGTAGEALWRAGAVTQRFFRDSVRYLGPLREAPHVLYDPGPSKLDLGVRGEYSAAVLHAQARTMVVMPTPAGAGERRRLSDALDFWLQEFGLADGAQSEDRGRMGIGLSVTPPGLEREVDLTSVGVGVSQILPVILLCLLAEPGTLLVLEQPELHLHPRLEQDLADFLLACARSGRQLVIETHSEHLVNRLRYRIAKDQTASTHELIRLVFAENRAGVTSYREPEINAYGGIGDDWPAGFLDLSARESQELVRESLAKRKRSAAASRGD